MKRNLSDSKLPATWHSIKYAYFFIIMDTMLLFNNLQKRLILVNVNKKKLAQILTHTLIKLFIFLFFITKFHSHSLPQKF
jgi:hypothetical protein